MSQGRYLKIVLTTIAATLVVLTATQLELPAAADAVAGERRATGAPQEEAEPPILQARAPDREPATLPLRWNITYARHVEDSYSCGTAVMALNRAPSTVPIEWFEVTNSVNSLGFNEESLLPSARKTWWADGSLGPLNLAGAVVETGDFNGCGDRAGVLTGGRPGQHPTAHNRAVGSLRVSGTSG